MKKIFLDLKKGPKHWYNEVVQARMKPMEVALGFSIGVFISMLPLPIINILLIFLAIAILKINKIAAMLGYVTVLWPTTPFIYYISLKLGLLIFRIDAAIPSVGEISFDFIKKYALAFVTGNLLLAAFTATASFMMIYGVMKLIELIKKRKQNILPPNNRAM